MRMREDEEDEEDEDETEPGLSTKRRATTSGVVVLLRADTCLRSSLFITTNDATHFGLLLAPARTRSHTHTPMAAHPSTFVGFTEPRVRKTQPPSTTKTFQATQRHGFTSRVAPAPALPCSTGVAVPTALTSFLHSEVGQGMYRIPRVYYDPSPSRVLIHQHSRSAYKATEPPTSELARTILMISLLFKGRAITEPQKAQLKARRTTDQQTARPR